MTVLSAILGFFSALPEMISLFRDTFNFIKSIVGDDPKKFMKDMSYAIDDLNKSTTQKEKQDAALKIHNLIRRL